jgi:hypothetical protein
MTRLMFGVMYRVGFTVDPTDPIHVYDLRRR